MSLAPPGTCVATFHATWAVLKAEKLLKAVGVAVKLVPVPRQISSNCGISLRFDCGRSAEVEAAIASLRGDLEGIYALDPAGAYVRRDAVSGSRG
jgi:hypothetical protein